jgi:tetratricopeptide (TPR) repeat protein
MQNKIFISYSTEDMKAVIAIADAVESARACRAKCWYSCRDIDRPALFPEMIMRSLVSSDLVMLVLSHNSNESDYVAREVHNAVSREKKILTIRIENVKPSDKLALFINTLSWVSVFSVDGTLRLDEVVDAVRSCLPPIDVPACMKEAADLEAQEKYAEALKLYECVLDVDPDHVEALLGKCSVLERMGLIYRSDGKISRHNESLNCLEIVTIKDPHNALAWKKKCVIYDAEEKPQDAICCINKAIEINPGDSEAYYLRGWIYNRMSKVAEARADYNEALRLDSKNYIARDKMNKAETVATYQRYKNLPTNI